MKKLLSIIVCLALTFGLVSCTGDISEVTVESDGTTSAIETETEETTEVITELPEEPDEEKVTYTNVNFSAVYYAPVKTEHEDESGETYEEITFEKQILIENVTLDLDFPKYESVTVLDGVKKIFETKEIFYVEDFSSIVCIINQFERVEDGYFYVWEYEINGVNPSERACNIPLESDMTIVYMLTAELDKAPSVDMETEDQHGALIISDL